MLKKILLLLICTTVITVSAISLMRYLLVNEVENHLIEEGFDKDHFDTSYYRNISLKGNTLGAIELIKEAEERVRAGYQEATLTYVDNAEVKLCTLIFSAIAFL